VHQIQDLDSPQLELRFELKNFEIGQKIPELHCFWFSKGVFQDLETKKFRRSYLLSNQHQTLDLDSPQQELRFELRNSTIGPKVTKLYAFW
jgi:hypothetical protein